MLKVGRSYGREKKEKKSLCNSKIIFTFAVANGADAAHCR